MRYKEHYLIVRERLGLIAKEQGVAITPKFFKAFNEKVKGLFIECATRTKANYRKQVAFKDL